ncbi:S41 family peptidase [Emticicia sp. BO119]|uniref:S41 family peptidase n=1 Tax=Emticicia sp. BO119 TaxID=2757768 RepID=UPI0015EFE483|nr:S41 family peptidase [Emticicia sp. BO119]MBA4853800.1 S41 family peptidase [Emticicia sp. BO119]
MKQLLYLLLLTIVTITHSACQKDAEPATNPEVEAYLNTLMSNMERYSINRKTINWETFRKNILTKAKGAQSIDDVKAKEAIQLALIQLEDSHSFFITSKGEYVTYKKTLNCTSPTPVIPTPGKEIGYVKVGTFSGSNLSEEANNYARAIQEAIKAADNDAIKGWIVDLRDNRGGNMWPMLVGIGPILGEGTAGYFIDPDNLAYDWGYKNGSAGGVQLSNPYVLKKPNPKVAVLIDEATASSGEAIAIAFKARSETSFLVYQPVAYQLLIRILIYPMVLYFI